MTDDRPLKCFLSYGAVQRGEVDVILTLRPINQRRSWAQVEQNRRASPRRHPQLYLAAANQCRKPRVQCSQI